VARHRFGPLRVLEIEGRTALLWVGYDMSLATLALDMMHADFDLVTGLLGRRRRPGLPGRYRPVRQLLADAPALRGARRLACHLYRRGARVRHARRFTGEGLAALTEYTAAGENLIGLPAASSPARR
jgi:hypothetical protein